MRSLTLLLIISVLVIPAIAAGPDYLPLAEGTRWVLKNPGFKQPVVLEITGRDGTAYRVRFSSPWASNDWNLEARGGKVYLTGYGQDGQVAPLPSDTLYFDFTSREGTNWKNQIGTMTVSKTGMTVRSGEMTLQSCIQMKQASGGSPLYFAFAPGVGFVQFGEGKNAFTLDLGDSNLPRAGARNASDGDAPVAHVPGSLTGGGSRPGRTSRPTVARVVDKRPVQVGITTITFANEPQTPENLLKRFQSTVDAGISFISAAQNWNEIEPRRGKYDFGGLDFQVQQSERLKVPMSVTFRIVDTVSRIVPDDVKKARWTDKKMEKRVMGMIDQMVPRFKGRVKWFMFGNEIDGYFGRHPNEISDFVSLYKKVAARVKQLSPGTQVSSTLMFGGIATLDGALRPLDEQFEFLAFTYYPIKPDFTMRAPDAPYKDFEMMRTYAGGRKVILQEIGYASADINGSSQEQQAKFYRAVFDGLRQNRDVIEAGNFFLLADLPDSLVKNLGKGYGLEAKVFLSFLQSVGMYDLQGRPKKSWDVFRQEAKRN